MQAFGMRFLRLGSGRSRAAEADGNAEKELKERTKDNDN
jgi:hypothetical protein